MTAHITKQDPPLPPDVQAAYHALKRAAVKARLLAEQTGTYFVYVENGKIIREIPSDSTAPKDSMGSSEET